MDEKDFELLMVLGESRNITKAAGIRVNQKKRRIAATLYKNIPAGFCGAAGALVPGPACAA